MNAIARENAGRLIEAMRRTAPGVVELARIASPAVRVEGDLLRRLRRLLPHLNAGVEGDLWFSPLVQTSGPRGIELGTEVANLLRTELAASPDLLRRSIAVIRSFHRDLPPALRLEEALIASSLAGDAVAQGDVDAIFAAAGAAIRRDKHDGVARWAMRALPELPDALRKRDMYWALYTIASEAVGRRMTEDQKPAPEQLHRLELPTGTTLGTAAIGVARRSGVLELTLPPAEDASHQVDLPSTDPIGVVVRWSEGRSRHRDIRFDRTRKHQIKVGYGEVLLEAADGKRFAVPPEDIQLSDVVLDEARDGWTMHAEALLAAALRHIDIDRSPVDAERPGLARRLARHLRNLASRDSAFLIETAVESLVKSGLMRFRLLAALSDADVGPGTEDLLMGMIRVPRGSIDAVARTVVTMLLASKLRDHLREFVKRRHIGEHVRRWMGALDEAGRGFRGASLSTMVLQAFSAELSAVEARAGSPLPRYWKKVLPDLRAGADLSGSKGETGVAAFVRDRMQTAVLTSSPGDGRMVADWLANTLAEEAEASGFVPLIIPAERLQLSFSADTKNLPHALLRALLGKPTRGGDEASNPFLLALAGQAILIIHGWDEAVLASPATVRRNFALLVQEFPTTPVVVPLSGPEWSLEALPSQRVALLRPNDADLMAACRTWLVRHPLVLADKGALVGKLYLALKAALPGEALTYSHLRAAIKSVAAFENIVARSISSPTRLLIDGLVSKVAWRLADIASGVDEDAVRRFCAALALSAPAASDGWLPEDPVVRRAVAEAGIEPNGTIPQALLESALFRETPAGLRQLPPMISAYLRAEALERSEAYEVPLQDEDPAARIALELAAAGASALRVDRMLIFRKQMPDSVKSADHVRRRVWPLIRVLRVLRYERDADLAVATSVVGDVIGLISQERRNGGERPQIARMERLEVEGSLFQGLAQAFRSILRHDQRQLPESLIRIGLGGDPWAAGVVADIVAASPPLLDRGFLNARELVIRHFAKNGSSASNVQAYPGVDRLLLEWNIRQFSGADIASRADALWQDPMLFQGRWINPFEDFVEMAASSIKAAPRRKNRGRLPYSTIARLLAQTVFEQPVFIPQPLPFITPPDLARALAGRIAGRQFQGASDETVASHLRRHAAPENLLAIFASFLIFSELCERWLSQAPKASIPGVTVAEAQTRAAFAGSAVFAALAALVSAPGPYPNPNLRNTLRRWAAGELSLVADTPSFR